MAFSIDLNADLGESFGAWKMGADEALLDVVTSANVACGFHAGDPIVMTRTVRHCIEKGVRIGAHPGFDDLRGFGRRRMVDPDLAELRAMVIYQTGALQAIAQASGAAVTHVKLHGALGNMASEMADIAAACIGAIRDLDPTLAMVAMAATHLQSEAERQGTPVLREVYADRAYNDDATLVSRGTPGAVIDDADIAAQRVLAMIDNCAIESINGARITVQPQTVCVHGDSAGAVQMAEKLRNSLERAGVTVESYSLV